MLSTIFGVGSAFSFAFGIGNHIGNEQETKDLSNNLYDYMLIDRKKPYIYVDQSSEFRKAWYHLAHIYKRPKYNNVPFYRGVLFRENNSKKLMNTFQSCNNEDIDLKNCVPYLSDRVEYILTSCDGTSIIPIKIKGKYGHNFGELKYGITRPLIRQSTVKRLMYYYGRYHNGKFRVMSCSDDLELLAQNAPQRLVKPYIILGFVLGICSYSFLDRS